MRYTMVTGTFTHYGYAVWETDDNGETADYPLHEAGNNKYESSSTVRPDSRSAENLDTIEKYCSQMVTYFALQEGLIIGEISHDLDRENELDQIYYDEAHKASQAA